MKLREQYTQDIISIRSLILGFEEFKDIIRVADLSLRCETFAAFFPFRSDTEILLFVELESNKIICYMSSVSGQDELNRAL